MKLLNPSRLQLPALRSQPSAKGLLIAVGIKSKTNTRVWCQAVQGEFPVRLLQRLERELAEVEAVDLQQPPVAFGLSVTLYEEELEEFPQFPDVWLEGAKNIPSGKLVPPDELFKIIWPD